MAHKPPQPKPKPKVPGSTSPQTGRTDAVDEAASASVSAPPGLPFTASTGALAMAHLNPVMRSEEAREYEAWLTQFSHLSLSGHDYLSDKDRVMYEAFIRRRPASAEVASKDWATFDAFLAAGEARTLLASISDINVPPASLKMYRDLVHGSKTTE